MGKFRGKRRKNKDQPEGQRSGENRAGGESYVATIIDHGNYKMEAYYAAQGLHNTQWTDNATLTSCSNWGEFEAERLRWRASATQILPASFRFAADIPSTLREKCEKEMNELLQVVGNDVVRPLQFLPHAYQLGVDRSMIRKDPNLKAFFEWVKLRNLAGFITRQETVSMVPPVVLQTQPGDCVLDMCAAPGSKTSQILERLGVEGSLIANENNAKRAHMLVSQLRRIMHMNPSVLVTCCDGQFFPSKILQFDRILCDVPCSGDGTSRKNIGVWKTWSQAAALSLHTLQLQIAWKGAANLLKVGGYMCYSTCSNNPTENEAVVAELLRKSNGALELVEVNLEGFKTRPGWTSWKVFCESQTQRESKNKQKKNSAKMMAKRREWQEKEAEAGDDGEIVAATASSTDVDNPTISDEPDVDEEAKASESKDDGIKERFQPTTMDEEYLIEMAKKSGLEYWPSYDGVPEPFRGRVRPSHFKPTDEEIASFHLRRCVRCLPNDNDTGGFFVALIRKVGDISVADRQQHDDLDSKQPENKRARLGEKEIESKQGPGLDDTGERLVKGNQVRDENGKSIQGLGKDDFVPVKDNILNELIDTFGLTESNFQKDLIMTRASSESKNIYYISRPIKNIIDKGIQNKVTVISSGLKAFVRSTLDGTSMYRVCQDAAHFLVPHMSKRKFVANIDDFEKCLTSERFIQIAAFSDDLQSQIRELSIGSFVLILDGYEDELQHKMVVTLWRCRTDRVDQLVAQVERDAIVAKVRSIREAL
ncbi:tRNA (cytosine34-C5)-methyltransferase [Fistulifera solaris]|uniref:tRNA (Cytosine34-C5)-methyltransferase n=1 Tax=Fistulifera solaris TaxID=1519565 RepID=A0A1Z5K7S9_FISSO|nr:tRNA (cytosine34-C5)-methyltransferase [Fistulifera solaris]|eukprot:GAX22323.1 tRNA (cytosine34-C5)-methyltransferase [Fistulifera solaris]